MCVSTVKVTFALRLVGTCDLVYKFRNIAGKHNFLINSKKKSRDIYKRIGYNVDVMRQSACLVVNPITVNKFGIFFNCMS